MTDYKVDQNSDVLSDEYRSDQRKSDQYAEAARQANVHKQNGAGANRGPRKVQFEQGSYDDQNDEVLARERAFRDSIESAGYQDDRAPKSQRSLDLDELDSELDQTGPVKTDGRIRRSERSEQLNPKRTSASVHNKRPQKPGSNALRDILSGLQQALFLALSKRPMQAFHLNLHWGSLGILALINVLLVAGLNTLIYSKFIKPALGGFSAILSAAKAPSGIKIFGISSLSQLSSIVAVIAMILILTIILGSEKKNLKQFVQTATLSTLPYSFILLISLICSIFLPQVGIILALTGKIHAFIYLYAGLQKGHPTKKNSPFWFFLLLIAVVLVVQYLFVVWGLR